MFVSRPSVHPPFWFLPFGIKITDSLPHSKSQLWPRTRKPHPKLRGTWSLALSFVMTKGKVSWEVELERGCEDTDVNVVFFIWFQEQLSYVVKKICLFLI